MFGSTLEFLRAELQRLDLLLHREILRLQAIYRLSLDEFRGLYISDQQVDLLVRKMTEDAGSPAGADLTSHAAQLRERNYAALPNTSAWLSLAGTFQLSEFEQDVLLLALAPEIDLKYETLYAYLHNDVTRKLPTCDLALRLFCCSHEIIRARRRLVSDATLFRDGLLQATPDQRSRLLGLEFSIAPAVTRCVLDLDTAERVMPPDWEAICLPASLIKCASPWPKTWVQAI